MCGGRVRDTDRQHRFGWVFLVGALALAAVGGAAAGLGLPVWLAGLTAAVTALIAGALSDHFFQKRDASVSARRARSAVLDALTVTSLGAQDDVLRLLRADSCAVPFHGRLEELQQLAAWCADDSACPVLIVSGSTGVGKSRLALKFASGLRQGWATGWLHVGAGGIAVREVRACEDPTVILVDDADRRVDVVALLNTLAEHDSTPMIRVILLTRSGAGLRAWLTSQVEERHQWIAERAVQLDLQPQGEPEDRKRWFANAIISFAEVLGVTDVDPSEPFPADLADPYQPILVLQARALLAVLGVSGHPEPNALSFDQVAEWLMNHEKRRWRAIAAAWDWGIGGPPSEQIQERCVAALALLGPSTQTNAVQILRRLPELSDTFAERLAAIASWVLAIYAPGCDGGPWIRPEMIGEWFVVRQLLTHPSLIEILKSDLTDAQAAHAIAFLARAADRNESAVALFEAFTSGDIRKLALAAAYAAMAGEVGGSLLDPIVAMAIRTVDKWTLDQLAEIDRIISRRVLPFTHLTVADMTVSLLRASISADPTAHESAFASALTVLSYALFHVGKHQRAVVVGREAVTHWRALAAADSDEHEADLAGALNVLCRALDRAGEYHNAVVVGREAVTHWRALAAAYTGNRLGLAVALTDLGHGLSQIGELQESLVASHEAETLLRALSADDPDAAYQAGYQYALASVLTNLGGDLPDIGKYDEALVAAREAVALQRQLANVDQVKYQAGLAAALNDLGNRLDLSGNFKEALAVTSEAATLWRDLARGNPAMHQPFLARTLGNLSASYDRVGRYAEAMSTAHETVMLWRGLAAANPAAHQVHLGITLSNLGGRLQFAEQYQSAIGVTREALTILRAAAAANPAAHEASVATCLINFGSCLSKLGNDKRAVRVTLQAINILRRLVKTNHVYQKDLAIALENLGSQLDRVGKYQRALAARAESVDLYREVASRHPDLFQVPYLLSLTALRREYEYYGMHDEALTHHLDLARKAD
jgi:tetratricopeptide (TPR) repeat protein